MLIKLTEQYAGVVNPDMVLHNEIVVNTNFIQSIKKMPKHYPFTEDYTTILMASGTKYNIKENFDYIYQKIADNETV